MRSNELRIGNLIIDSKGRICRLDGIKLDDTTEFEIDAWPIMGGGVVSLPFEPIPLTEEWLIKFGFEQLTKKSNGFKSGSYSYSGKVSLILNHDGLRTWTNFWQGNEMRYVHQLQNLYFALTGKELTIKE